MSLVCFLLQLNLPSEHTITDIVNSSFDESQTQTLCLECESFQSNKWLNGVCEVDNEPSKYVSKYLKLSFLVRM